MLRMDWSALPLQRLRGTLALLFVTTFLAAGVTSFGAGLLARAQADAARVPEGARYFVVVRSLDAAAVRGALLAVSGADVVAEKRAGELLARAGVPEVGPEHLVVFEVLVPSPADAGALRGLDAVVDVIDVNAVERAAFTRARVARGVGAAVVVLALGVSVFVWAVVAAAQASGRECQDAIGVRVLLGAEAEGLWGPLGLVVGGVALAGGLASFALAATAAQVALRLASFPVFWALVGTVALLVGTLGLSFGAARRAVARAARATVLASALVAAWMGPAEATRAEGAAALADPTDPADEERSGPAHDADLVRALSREISVCRRTLHVARKGLAATEYQAVVAVAEANDPLLRLAAHKRTEDAARVGEIASRCSDLEAEREHLRDVLRSTRLHGPPIRPRQVPVEGRVAVRYGQAGRRPGTAGFRNGIALRTRGGESVRATAPGRVAYAGDLPGSGSVVVIDHGRRTYSVYAKIGSSLVSAGDEVDSGQTVARARTGLLYFSVRRRGRPVDPLAWVSDAPRSKGS